MCRVIINEKIVPRDHYNEYNTRDAYEIVPPPRQYIPNVRELDLAILPLRNRARFERERLERRRQDEQELIDRRRREEEAILDAMLDEDSLEPVDYEFILSAAINERRRLNDNTIVNPRPPIRRRLFDYFDDI